MSKFIRGVFALLLFFLSGSGCTVISTTPAPLSSGTSVQASAAVVGQVESQPVPDTATVEPARTLADIPVQPTTVSTAEVILEEPDSMQIRLITGDAVLLATLNDSQTTRDFVSLLPLALTLEDYAGTEKISDLPRQLSIEGAPSGSDPSIGDITYYAPWGNLAIFYQDFGYANGLVILGNIADGMDALSVPGSLDVTIELVD